MNTNKEVYSRWFFTEICENCLTELSDSEIYYNKGVCPYCTNDSNSTICDTVKKHYRYVYKIKKFLGFIPFKSFLRIENKS